MPYVKYMQFDWNEEKNSQLKKSRNISLERIVIAIEGGEIFDILENLNKNMYANQYLMIVHIDNYAYVVPAVQSNGNWFLKTILPSRKYTDRYLPDVRRST